MASSDTRVGPVEVGFVDDLVVATLSDVFPQIRDVELKVSQLTETDKEGIAMAGWTDFVSGRGRHFFKESLSAAQREEVIEIFGNRIKIPASV